MSPQYAAVCRNLRAIRKARNMSLLDVEQASKGVLAAISLGSYERGDRVLNVSKALLIAEFYGVTITELLDPSVRCSKCEALSYVSDVMV